MALIFPFHKFHSPPVLETKQCFKCLNHKFKGLKFLSNHLHL